MTESVLGYEVGESSGQQNPITGLPPEFTLKATDRCAPAAILRWIEGAAAAGSPNNKLRGAFEIYLAMIVWQQRNPAHTKTPD